MSEASERVFQEGGHAGQSGSHPHDGTGRRSLGANQTVMFRGARPLGRPEDA